MALLLSNKKPKIASRSTNLIADFKHGFAKNWFFYVGDFFMDQLDIRPTERIQNNTKTMVLTQGPFFCFTKGHILYDTKNGYLIWKDALKYIHFVCSVIEGIPCSIEKDGKINNGHVHFNLSRPNKNKTRLEKAKNYHTTQTLFVNFLKTGTLKYLVNHNFQTKQISRD